MKRQALVFGMAVLVAACQAAQVPVGSSAPGAQAASPDTARPVGSPAAAVGGAAPQVTLPRARNANRVARPIADPAPGAKRQVASYWTMTPAEPFEVVDTLITSKAAEGAGTTVDMSARVVLPSGKAVAKAYRLASAELDEADDAGDEADLVVDDGSDAASEADQVRTKAAAPGKADLSPDEADVILDMDDEDVDGDGDADFELVHASFTDADVPEADAEDAAELADAEVDGDDFLPTFDPETDDVPDDLPDYVVDADGDDLFEADEARPYVDPFTKELKARVMAKGHEISLTFEDEPMMADTPDRCVLTDKSDGERLEIEMDQEGNRLTLRNGAGTLRFGLNPDDTMNVGERRAKDAAEAARLMAAEPVVKATGTHMLALLFTRRARAPLPATRGKYPCNTDDTRFAADSNNRAMDRGGNDPYVVLGVPEAAKPRAFYDPVGDMLRLLIQGRVGLETVRALEAMAKTGAASGGGSAGG